jgi:GH25 family lysozyme M1 (1,4-beta-N-acetylmuramidase)
MSGLFSSTRFRGRWFPVALVAALVAAFAAVAITTRGGSHLAGTAAATSAPTGAPTAAQQAAEATASPSPLPTSQPPGGDKPRSDVALPHSKRVLQELAGGKQTTPVHPSVATSAAPLQGVDVSCYQHNPAPNCPQAGSSPINWPQVAGDGYAFAFIKATEATYYTNTYYASDFQDAKAAGLDAAAYAFANPYNDPTSPNGTAAQQADSLIQNAGYTPDGKTLPLTLDIEYNPYISQEKNGNDCYGLNQNQMITWIQDFITEIQNKTGETPIIYTVGAWWSECTGDTTQFSSDPLWIADYSNSGSPQLTGGWTSWKFWQYTSTGTVNGINGNTDVDYFNGDAAALNTMTNQPITISNPGSQSGTAGDPVWKTVTAADADGGTLAYSATGLPPGLSINSSTGRISGWLTTQGSYTATVTASDSNGSNSTSFPWQVNAASGSGPSGHLVLANGGKCVDDPGYNTAAGTRLDIWNCVSQTNEKWTIVQDGTLRVLGACMDVSGGGTGNGTAVDLAGCDGSAAQQWRIGSWGELVNPQSGRCLDDPGWATANGTKLDIWDCVGSANERWAAPAGPMVSQIAPLCIDDNAWSTANGNPIDVWGCNGGGNEAVTVATNGELQMLGKCLDIYQAGTGNGTPIDLYSCNVQAPNQQWRPQADGTMLNPASGRCLADPSDNPANGTRLVIYDCGTSAGENWHRH